MPGQYELSAGRRSRDGGQKHCQLATATPYRIFLPDSSSKTFIARYWQNRKGPSKRGNKLRGNGDDHNALVSIPRHDCSYSLANITMMRTLSEEAQTIMISLDLI